MGWVGLGCIGLGWVGSLHGWVGLGRVTENGPTDNSAPAGIRGLAVFADCLAKGTG